MYLLGKQSHQELHLQIHNFLHQSLRETFHHPPVHSPFLHLKETETGLQNT